MKSSEKIRLHYVFEGRVQGVGFRYRAYYAAQSNRVTGWVRNNCDGSVEMEAEGRESDIDRMLIEIRDGRFVQIDNFSRKEIPLENSRSFKISGY